MLGEWFLAGRYLKPRRNAVGIITLISIVGVSLGVAVLIIVLAVMTGFTDLMRDKLLDTEAHIQIKAGTSNEISTNLQKRVREAAQNLNIKIAPVIAAPAMLQVPRFDYLHRRDDAFDFSLMTIGVNPKLVESQMDLASALKMGSFELNKGDIVISTNLAYKNNLRLGDKVLLHSPQHLTQMVKIKNDGKIELNREDAELYLPGEFVIRGLYSFGKSDFDNSVIFIGADDAAEVFDLPLGYATSLYGWIDDPLHVEKPLDKLRTALADSGLKVWSWKELHSQLLGVLAMEKRMMFFLLIFIVLVAAFSITNTLITTVYQKTREIGVLKALGSSDGQIMRIFLYQGVLVGLLGSLSGTLLGCLVIYYRNGILRLSSKIAGVELFPAEFYYFNELPAHIVAGDVLTIIVVSVLLCTLGAVIPALHGAKLDPAKALRYE